MRDCAECGKPVDGPSCKACGYIDLPLDGTTTQHGPVRDANWGRCAHLERGLRCARAGSVSRETSGPSGDGKWKRQWFCYDHAFPSQSASREPSPPGIWAAIKRRLVKAIPLGERE